MDKPILPNGWNFENETDEKKITGYEKYFHKLEKWDRKLYKSMTPKQKRKLERKVFAIYRGENIFPIHYFNQDGIDTEIKKLIKKQVEYDGSNVLAMKHIQGLNLCRYLYPNLMKVDIISDRGSMYDRFYDDKQLMKAIRFVLNYDDNCKPSALLGGLRMTGTAALNFMPLRAQALYEHFCPKDGVILDFAHGFGGRLLGALTSSKYNYHYIGIDPNTETSERTRVLGKHIENVTGRNDSFELHCMGSEEYVGEPDSVDFAFSSPPYFNLEQYTTEDTQCYHKYPELVEWFDGYVRETVKMLYRVLKPGAYYAVNIADFKNGSQRVEYVDEWIRISQEEGFEHFNDIEMVITRRRGAGHRDNKGEEKRKAEGIFVFRKPI
jgi:hypothetical protein